MRLVDRLLGEFVAQAMLVDRDQREAARGERVAEHRIDPRADPRRPAGDFAQYQVADRGILELENRELAPFALVDRRQPPAIAFLPDDAEGELGRAGELLHRVGDEARALLLGAAEHAIADPERPPPPPLHEAQPRRRRLGVPLLRDGPAIAAVVDGGNAKHGHPGHAPGLVEGTARRAVDQALVGHVLEQALQVDLVLAGQPERARDLALAGRLVGRSDEVEDLLAAGETGGSLGRSIARRSR
jgi:hypothetical protein